MTAPLTAENMSPGLLKVAERAKQSREFRFRSVAHLIDEDALTRAYHRLRADAAVGIDCITKEMPLVLGARKAPVGILKGVACPSDTQKFETNPRGNSFAGMTDVPP